jgi:hypothetical protein
VQDISERPTFTVDETFDLSPQGSADGVTATQSPRVDNSVAHSPESSVDVTFPWLQADERVRKALNITLPELPDMPELEEYFSRMKRLMAEGTDVEQSPGRRGRHSDVTPRQVYFVVMWLAHR